MKYFIYRNIPKRTYSIKALEGPQKGRVVAYADVIDMVDVTFTVSQAGRNKVLLTGQKNVHAGIVGTIVGVMDQVTRKPNTLPESTPAFDATKGISVRYNPYTGEHFETIDTKTPVHNAKRVVLFFSDVLAYGLGSTPSA